MSMSCPKCAKNALCIDSRRGSDGSTRRRYKCKSRVCGSRWSTAEVVIRMDEKKRRPGDHGESLENALRRKVITKVLKDAVA